MEFEALSDREAVLPPVQENVAIGCEDVPLAPEQSGEAAEPITAFVCAIEYRDSSGGYSARLIRCQRYVESRGTRYVYAYCHLAGALRQFRVDRITSVSDATTGEVLGDGSYFARFSSEAGTPGADTWGLKRHQKAIVVAGLNVLSFLARCDGHYHPLEEEVIERFVCSLYLRKEWESEPPLSAIVGHARRLAPDGAAFFSALNVIGHSRTTTRVVLQAAAAVIEADGFVCADEVNWMVALRDHLTSDRFTRLGMTLQQWQ